ncbi:F-box protein SKIP22-like protein [Cinnamomum micranthum f. kanehirae]|uniref:F-box protein SKIP22-like protein n=1 Tax=Cinnamomum micranthum f. kanehirae TaxID=337451 RepID=A0A443N5Z4_9MAGN|nr:F-box protein SKIP22-like protein [Cinnamomum micranthum f. kanehirae]
MQGGNPNPRKPQHKETPSSSNSICDMDIEAPSQSSNENPTQIPNPIQEDLNPKSSEIPCFLRKVFDAEIENVAGNGDHRLIIIAVHAVFLESGFISVDPATNSAVSGGCLPKKWASSGPVFSIRYTLPSLAISACNSILDTVTLKFQTLDRFVSIYGCLDSKGSELRRVSVDTVEFAPFIDYVYRGYEEEGDLETTRKRVFFEFWKIVKDGLSTPLLIALCIKKGLPLPSCFMVLPTDVKLMILELVSAADVAKIGCVCSELKYLSSNDELWKKKFEEEFGMWDGKWGAQVGGWKERFLLYWESRKTAPKQMEEQVRSMAPFRLWGGWPRFRRIGPIGGNWYTDVVNGDDM